MLPSRYKVSIIVESILLFAALGLGLWWYVHNHVVREVDKVFEDGSSYKGEWLAGEMHGKGVLTLADASVYDGEFLRGRKQGHGKLKGTDGAEYEGFWLDDIYHGEGRYTSATGNVYEG